MSYTCVPMKERRTYQEHSPIKKENQLSIKWPRQEAKISRKLIRQLWLKKKFRVIKKLFINNLYIGTSGNSYFEAAVEGKCRGKQK